MEGGGPSGHLGVSGVEGAGELYRGSCCLLQVCIVFFLIVALALVVPSVAF